jgi:hypothetical protein
MTERQIIDHETIRQSLDPIMAEIYPGHQIPGTIEECFAIVCEDAREFVSFMVELSTHDATLAGNMNDDWSRYDLEDGRGRVYYFPSYVLEDPYEEQTD